MATAAVAAASSGNNTLVAAPGANRAIRVQGIFLMGTGTVSGYLLSGTVEMVGGAAAPLPLASGTGFCLQPVSNFWFECGENKALILNLSGATGVGGIVIYDIVKSS